MADWQTGFVVRDLPWTTKRLRNLPPFEFENWAVIALGGVPNAVQVGDMGIDGKHLPRAAAPSERSRTAVRRWTLVSDPSQTEGQGWAPDIDAFEAVMTREDRQRFFVSFDYTSDALGEIDAFFRKSGKVIVPFTVREILDEHLAAKLA